MPAYWHENQTPLQAPTGTDGFAIAALVLGIVPVFVGVLGIVFGFVARRRIKRTGRNGKPMATAGIVLGSAWLGIVAVFATMDVLSAPGRDAQGAVTKAGDVFWSDLRVGDCVDGFPGDLDSTEPVVPCDVGTHYSEVFATFPWVDQDERTGLGRCVKELYGYLGVARGRDTGYDVKLLHPLGNQDGTGVCLLVSTNRDPLRGPARPKGAA
jgi:hypothetical protein